MIFDDIKTKLEHLSCSKYPVSNGFEIFCQCRTVKLWTDYNLSDRSLSFFYLYLTFFPRADHDAGGGGGRAPPPGGPATPRRGFGEEQINKMPRT
jgi:hypothetical protein